MFEEDYQTNTNDYAKNEAEFMRYLQNNKMGLKLYKGSTADFSRWDGISLDSNNKPVTNKCNQ
jgi:hypothetical protein